MVSCYSHLQVESRFTGVEELPLHQTASESQSLGETRLVCPKGVVLTLTQVFLKLENSTNPFNAWEAGGEDSRILITDVNCFSSML